MSVDIYNILRGFLDHEGIKYQQNVPLSGFCTFKIGGPADFVVMPESSDELIGLIDYLSEYEIYFDIFGNGSNLLFDDEGFRGAAIFTSSMRSIVTDGDIIHAECGASLNRVAGCALNASLSGLEFAYGIPGSVGGAVYMNAGAFEQSVSDVIIECLSFDPVSGELSAKRGVENGFSYRHSVYSDGNYIVMSAVFKLSPGNKDEIKTRMDDYIHRRAEKQPLNYPSAGSVFKRYPGYYTAQLIDEAGLKGVSIGGAQVSTKHAGFIVNTGGATSSDVKALISLITETIYKKYGITIEREIKYISSK